MPSSLGQETGQTPERRLEEAQVLLARLAQRISDDFTPRERNFIEGMNDAEQCSGKQLFWLRDLVEKYDV